MHNNSVLSQRRLIDHLMQYGYIQDVNVPCLFQHHERGTIFTLVVDDFAIKYKREEDAQHFIDTLNKLGFHITFDDVKHTVSFSMPQYIPKVLARFFPNEIIRGAKSPAIYTPPNYGRGDQIEVEDTSQSLNEAEIKRLQEIIGSLLFYARAIDSTMLTAVNHLASLQSKPESRGYFQGVRYGPYGSERCVISF